VRLSIRLLLTLITPAPVLHAQQVPPAFDPRLDSIAGAPASARIAADIRRLADFGTRHTLSDTTSPTHGIGAARRWIHAEFERISASCGGCLEVRYVQAVIPGNPDSRIREPLNIVNVVAIQRGSRYPTRAVVMAGDIDSRVSDVMDGTSDSPGANDNASGMAGTLEAARVLSRYRFDKTIIYTGLSGEEQGLFGGTILARWFADSGWTIEGLINNDMIGNTAGITGIIDNRTFRIFSEPTSVIETEADRRNRRIYGGEVDGPSRQLARYIDAIARQYLPDLRPKLVYRLDRFGRGGHHRPFNDLGMPAVRLMEAHEHYDRQHQDLRTEGARVFGDVVSGVDTTYAARLTAANATTLAAVAWAPPPPVRVRVQGAVSASTTVSWAPDSTSTTIGYKVYWRDTTEPRWTHWRWVPAGRTIVTLTNVVIDDHHFGVAAVGPGGHESVVQYPTFGR
jgi:hypothetical protein